jgi:hypothetical protein
MSYFAFILTDFKYKGELPVELIDGHYLNKPDPLQLQAVKKILSSVSPRYNYDFFEKNREIREIENGLEVIPSDIPRDEWRYWVINFEGSLMKIEPLKYILNLAFEQEVTVGFVCNKSAENNQYHFISTRGQILPNHFANNSLKLKEILKISTEELHSVATLHEKLNSACKINDSLFGTLDEYEMLKDLPYTSKFKTLGYFAIIESLVTRKPKASDPGDSIRRQLKSKMNLLNNRFNREIETDAYFEKETNFDTIWGKLYDYRSDIAHGNSKKFGKEYQCLKNIFAIDDYLNQVSRAVVKQCVLEPQLMVDLKDC